MTGASMKMILGQRTRDGRAISRAGGALLLLTDDRVNGKPKDDSGIKNKTLAGRCFNAKRAAGMAALSPPMYYCLGRTSPGVHLREACRNRRWIWRYLVNYDRGNLERGELFCQKTSSVTIRILLAAGMGTGMASADHWLESSRRMATNRWRFWAEYFHSMKLNALGTRALLQSDVINGAGENRVEK